MTHDIGAAVEVHASAGLSLAAKGETNCCERLRNRAESEVLKGAQTLFPRGNAELQPCRLAVCMVTSRQWRVPSDKKKNLLARCGHRNKNAMVYPSSGSFYRAFACGATLLVCAASAADGKPIPPGTLEPNARNRWIVAGRTLDLGLHFQLEKFLISTEC